MKDSLTHFALPVPMLRQVYVGGFFRYFFLIFFRLRFLIAFFSFGDRFSDSFIEFASQNHPQKGLSTVPKTVQKWIQKKVLFLKRFWTFFHGFSYQNSRAQLSTNLWQSALTPESEHPRNTVKYDAKPTFSRNALTWETYRDIADTVEKHVKIRYLFYTCFVNFLIPKTIPKSFQNR